MENRSTSPPPLSPGKRIRYMGLTDCFQDSETGCFLDREISVQGSNTGFSSEKLYKWAFRKREGPKAALKGEEKPMAAEGPEAASKAAGYYWFKLKLGEPLTPKEMAKAADYSLEDLLDQGLTFCTICGQENHRAYSCVKYFEEYKCPYGSTFVPPGINQYDKKPSDIWTEWDEEYFRILCIDDYVPEGFEYLCKVSEIKNIHRAMIQQHNEIEQLVGAGIEPKCEVRKTSGEHDHQTK